MAWGSNESKGNATSAGAKKGGGMLSFIGSEVTVTGNISGSGDIHLDGVVDGDVACKTLTLGSGGRVRGNIVADRATLGGTVDGTVSASTLTIEKSARISGDLAYDNVSIETGAQVDGRVAHRAGSGQSEPKLLSVVGE